MTPSSSSAPSKCGSGSAMGATRDEGGDATSAESRGGTRGASLGRGRDAGRTRATGVGEGSVAHGIRGL
eukprot:2262692-Pleurochrysis_carterae.AAC.1